MTDEKDKTAEAKKIEKPDREAFEKAIAELDAQIKKNQAIIDEVKTKLDGFKAEKEKAADNKEKKPVSPEQVKLNKIREEMKAINEERKGMIELAKKQKVLKEAARDKYEDARKRIKEANVLSQEALDKKIRDLEFHMTTTSLTLREEKQCMTDIKQLNANRKVFSELDAARIARDQAETISKDLNAKLNASKEQLDKLHKEDEALFQAIQAKREVRPKSEVPALIEKRDKARAELNKLYPQLNALRTEFQAKENEFRKYLNEKRKEQQKKYEEDQKKYREEKKARDLEKEEESFEFLHADKIVKIDQLVTYLKTRMESDKEDTQAETVETPKPSDENLIGKYAQKMEDDVYGTKKAQKAPKKKAPKKKATGLVHDLNVLVEFSNQKLSPPLTTADIPAAIEALQKKKEEWKKDKEVQYQKHLAKKAAIANGTAQEESEQPTADAAAATTESAPVTDAAAPSDEKEKKGKGKKAKKTDKAEGAPAAVEATA